MRHRLVLICLFCVLFFSAGIVQGAPESEIRADVRCSVCGMFVAKYEGWIVQIRLSDNAVMFFDGVKDMMVYYHNPQQYNSYKTKDILEIWVKDYYTLEWLDGFKAFYVIGSDVYGPMGKEFIPFASRAGAENFLKDHKGVKIVALEEITDELVQSMRAKSKMLHKAN